MTKAKALKYEEILQAVNHLSKKQQLRLIQDISANLQQTPTRPIGQKNRAQAGKTLANLRGILPEVRFSEKEFESAKYRPKSLADF